MSQGGLHILGGKFKGRKLLSPQGKGTRPMTGLAKKSLFGMLEPWLEGALVLDLYCGTGTLGLESLSRGASMACFAEKDFHVVDRLLRNIETCGVGEEAEVWEGDIEVKLTAKLATLVRPTDVVFLDPPFPAVREWDFSHYERILFEPLAEVLANDGILVLRTPGDLAPPEKLASLIQKRMRTYGDMIIAFYQRADLKTSDPDEPENP